MRTIALRFADRFAPDVGTIAAHQAVVNELGYVWYGKLGTPISVDMLQQIMSAKEPRILLIHSGKPERYWAYVEQATRKQPEKTGIPSYYRDKADDFKTWFKVLRFEAAPKDIMSECIVPSSGNSLSMASRHSMSPYFKIVYPTKETID